MLRVLEWTTFRLEGNQYLLDCARGIRKYSEPTGMQAAQFLYDLGANGYLHENFAAADLAEPGAVHHGANRYVLYRSGK